MTITELENKYLGKRVNFLHPIDYKRYINGKVIQVSNEQYLCVRTDKNGDYWPLIDSVTIVED